MTGNQRARIRMSPGEIAAFLAEQRVATMCTMHPDGSIHAVAMWYALLDGELAVETKRKSQKVQNLRRDPRVTFLVEAGQEYSQLRGVQIVAEAQLAEDPECLFRVGVSIWERYKGPYDEADAPQVKAMMRNRVVVRPVVQRIVSWDHRKLAVTLAA